MIFVGKATAEKLLKSGIKTIGEIAVCDPKRLTALLGKQGQMLWTYANGYDTSPVARYGEGEDMKSIGNGMTFRRGALAASGTL